MRTSPSTIALLAPVLAVGTIVAVAPPSQAATEIAVTTTDDELNADGDCSLREAVVALNTGTTSDACMVADDVGRITLQPGATYRLTIPGADEDAALTGDLDILLPVSIEAREGYDTSPATIDAGGLDRVFDIHESAYPFRVSLAFLLLTNGDAGAGDGGGVRISPRACDPNDAGSLRSIDLWGVIIDGNRALRGGGVFAGGCNGLVITASSIVRNSAGDVGGGIAVEGDSYLDIEGSTVPTNEAEVAGGGIWTAITHPFASWSAFASTIGYNRAPEGGGLWAEEYGQAFTTIVAANDGGNCGGPQPASAGLSDDDSCGGPGVADAGLRPLAIVAGYPVHLLEDHSPAIERAGPVADGAWCSDNLQYDQIGTFRPQDGDGDGVAACDVGSIEAPGVPVESAEPSAPPLPDTAVHLIAPPKTDRARQRWAWLSCWRQRWGRLPAGRWGCAPG